MPKRKHSKLHEKWTRRVEGQIKCTINAHPDWFIFFNEHTKKKAINSLTKRIVGEIVADLRLAAIPENE